MIAVVPVRDGVLPLGAEETIAECDGDAILIGSGCPTAASALVAATRRVRLAEVGGFAPAGWAAALGTLLAGEDVVLLPASPDGRDLAPHLAVALDLPLWAGATAVSPETVTISRHGGRALAVAPVDGPIVATLIPGVRSVTPGAAAERIVEEIALTVPDLPTARQLEVLAPRGAALTLADAPRIVAGGVGLGTPEAFGLLTPLGEALDAAVGATRVVTDRGWAPHQRQIGTTGVTVAPELYLAFGISGAVQHLSGVEPPRHTVAVNLDASCPMMAAADLAVVADAPAVLAALVGELDHG